MSRIALNLSLAGLVALSVSACAVEPEEEPVESSDAALGSCEQWSVLAGGAAAMTVTLATATATCAGALAVTGPGEVVCLLPAGTTTVAALTGLAAGLGVWLTCRNSGRQISAEIQAPAQNGTRARTCNPADLAPSCSCAELDRRYRLQEDLCDEGGRCSSTTTCGAIARVLAASRNCINARRNVQLCYRRPDFDGHQTQINNQCWRFRGCANEAALRCDEEIIVPLLPSPCAF